MITKEARDRIMEPAHPPGLPDEPTRRITILTDKLETCMELSQALQTRHAGTVQQIDDLHTKVKDLEELLQTTEREMISRKKISRCSSPLSRVTAPLHPAAT